MRGIGVVGAATELLPEWATPIVVAITLLGEPELLLVVVTLLYWLGPAYEVMDRRSGLRLLAVTMTALAVVATAKHWFSLGRPPTQLPGYSAEGYGFPSGHATAAAAVYSGIAWWSTIATPRRRWRVAATVIGLVALSRVLLGVHYLVDVVAGVITGVGVVVVIWSSTRARIMPGFLIAASMGMLAAVLTGLDPTNRMTMDAALAMGGTLGAACTWGVIALTNIDLATPAVPTIAVGVIGALSPLALVILGTPSVGVTIGVAAFASAVGVGLPAVRTFRDTGLTPTG